MRTEIFMFGERPEISIIPETDSDIEVIKKFQNSDIYANLCIDKDNEDDYYILITN